MTSPKTLLLLVLFGLVGTACGDDCVPAKGGRARLIEWDDRDPSSAYTSRFSPREIAEALSLRPWRPVGSKSRDAELLDVVVEFSDPRDLRSLRTSNECSPRFLKVFDFTMTVSTTFGQNTVTRPVHIDVEWRDSAAGEFMRIDGIEPIDFSDADGRSYWVGAGIMTGSLELWFGTTTTGEPLGDVYPDSMLMAQTPE